MARAVAISIKKKTIIAFFKVKREGGSVVMLSIFFIESISLSIELPPLDEAELTEALNKIYSLCINC